MLNGLNPAQRKAVETTSGPLLVLAGAGSGKTRVITFRIAHLIQEGVPADRILAVTFTNKAAGEMQQRALELIRKRNRLRPMISTFHSLCLNILRQDITLLGFPHNFSIYDRKDQESVARAALRDISCPNSTLRPGDLLHRISSWKCQGKRADQIPDHWLEDDRDDLAAAAFRRYEKSMRAAAALDFDDLLLCTEELFANHPDALQRHQRRFDHILVDEYQDTNGTQFKIVSALAAPHQNLCVVGDDDQSIYAWRGADVENILSFSKDYPDAEVVTLEENYRSTPEILQLANKLIQYNAYRQDKSLRAMQPVGAEPRFLEMDDEVEEAKFVVDEIKRAIQYKQADYRDFAILFRTNEQPRIFESELRSWDIPYVLIGGMSFFDRREVRDMLAYLKLMAKPDDEVALLRVINRPARGIGETTVAKLLEKAVHDRVPLWSVLGSAAKDGDIPYRAAQAIEQLCTFLDQWRASVVAGPLHDQFREMILAMDYRAELERSYKDRLDRENRWRTIEEFVNALAQYERRAKRRATIDGFLEDIALASREEESDKENKLKKNSVVLMTLHSAKGLEFPHVYLVGMEEGILPHDRSIEQGILGITEERRLAYVGVTRARNRLTLTTAKGRTKWGKRRKAKASRFLAEMRGETKVPRRRKSPPKTRRPARKGGRETG